METDDNVYTGIYSIVERRLAANGLTPPCSCDAFLSVRKWRLGELRIAELSRLDNRSFVEAIFMILWNRPPTPEEKTVWSDDFDTLAPQDFQLKVMAFVASKRANIRINEPGLIDILLNKTYNHVFLKTPKPFQKFIRDNFKKG